LIGANARQSSETHEGSVGRGFSKGLGVAVKALFENLEDGAGGEDFLLWFSRRRPGTGRGGPPER